jgi:RNA polymerase-binding transcription factor DksA
MSQAELKSRLEEEQTQLLSELCIIATQHPQTGDWVAVPANSDGTHADSNTNADAVEEWNERRAVLAQLEIRYKNLTRALEKMKDASYGICEMSGDPIEEERLQANPAARTNIANMGQEVNLPL